VNCKDFLAQLSAEGFRRHGIEGKADDGEILGEKIFLREVNERGNEFSLGEVAAGAKDDHHARGALLGKYWNAVFHKLDPFRPSRRFF